MIQVLLVGLAILGTGLVGLFAAVIVILASRSADEAMPRSAGTMDLAGATASPRVVHAGEGVAVVRSISSLHRRLPSPASAMEAA